MVLRDRPNAAAVRMRRQVDPSPPWVNIVLVDMHVARTRRWEVCLLSKAQDTVCSTEPRALGAYSSF
jgi:hypothetical protein